MEPTRIVTGLSDGQYTEVVSGLAEGARVITGVATPARAGASPSPGTTNPFNPQMQRRRR